LIFVVCLEICENPFNPINPFISVAKMFIWLIINRRNEQAQNPKQSKQNQNKQNETDF
jgi:hypothetical protein